MSDESDVKVVSLTEYRSRKSGVSEEQKRFAEIAKKAGLDSSKDVQANALGLYEWYIDTVVVGKHSLLLKNGATGEQKPVRFVFH
jgi:hypothetical protein